MMYWGVQNPDVQDVIDALVEQLKILNCSNVIIERIRDWVVIGSQDDWICSGLKLGKTVGELFEKGVGFPEKGGNSLRCEFFVYTFSRNICLWRENKLQELKSSVDEELKQLFTYKYPDTCLVAFTGNMYQEVKGS